jgi:hypothetical protein
MNTSLKNIAVLFALILAMMGALGAVLVLGTLADQHIDKIQMRLKSQRENRQPPAAESAADTTASPE